MDLVESIRNRLQFPHLGSTQKFKEFLDVLRTKDHQKIIAAKLDLNENIKKRFPHKELIRSMIDIEDATFFILDLVIPADFSIPSIRIDWDFALGNGPEFLNQYGVRQRLLAVN